MIGRIKNIWLRRAVLIIAFVPLMVLSLLIGAAAGAWACAEECFGSAHSVWRKGA